MPSHESTRPVVSNASPGASAAASNPLVDLTLTRSISHDARKSLDSQLGELSSVVSRLAPPPGDPAAVQAAQEAIGRLQGRLGCLAVAEKRLNEIAEALYRLASLDFTAKLELQGDGGLLDAVGGCINMLSEELEAHLDERSRVERSLEERVQERTAALAASAERYKTLVESTHAVPWEADARTLALSYISPQASALLGTQAGELVGNGDLWARVHESDRSALLEGLAALSESSLQHREFEYRVIRADGTSLDVLSVVASQKASESTPATLRGITFDVSQRKRLERELQQAQKLESVGRLAAGIAHELNTPVQFVNDSVHFVRDSFSELASLTPGYRALTRAVLAGDASVDAARQLIEEEKSLDLDYLLENVPVALDRSEEGLGRITEIVRSMKEFAHPGQKDQARVDLNHAIESTLIIARNEYKYVAEVSTDLAALPLVLCHVGDINQAILNIVVNAAHAIESHAHGAGKGRITVQTRRDGDSVVVSIADTGGGIPEAIRARIFEPFFTTKERGRGTGQGLAIARSVIEERHGGQLRYETCAGAGTTFFIRLPIDGTTKPPNGRSPASTAPPKWPQTVQAL